KMLEAAEADITFANGAFSVVGTDRALPLQDVARAAFQPGSLPRGVEPGLYETGTFSPLSDTWPNGCHVCEVEIDPETGAVALVVRHLDMPASPERVWNAIRHARRG